MIENISQIAGKKLNMDTHPSLLGERDITYMMNGDVQGKEGSNSWFAQNALGNSLCVDFPTDYTLIGSVPLNNFETVLFFVIGEDEGSEIGLMNIKECSYTMWANDACLGFKLGHPIRGVYKHNNRDNDRRVYFIDGYNANRYLDIDKLSPKTYTGTKCDDCDLEFTENLDCKALPINKSFTPPCATLSSNFEGQLLSGVYQVGIAYILDDQILTDYYFTPPVKIFSESSNIGIKVELDCNDVPFDEYSVVLITQTRESSLTVYDLGNYSLLNKQITITNLNNATVLDTATAFQKRVVYDYSEHIATNGESLFIGKHKSDEPLNYQLQALNIETMWQEVQVPKDQAFKYPSFLRDEVYALAIEWFHLKGYSLGVSHIPGREALPFDLELVTGPELIYEIEDCVTPTYPIWKIENTASATATYDIECENCSGEVVSKEGIMGYWESENLRYPNLESFGEFACQPVRHHRMPTTNVSPLTNPTYMETLPSSCVEYDYIYYNEEGYPATATSVYCTEGQTREVESNCVNVLTIKLDNIEHPKDEDGNPRTDIAGYRILVADRKGNKSILHKGLIYNCWVDQSLPSGESLYPNYPYNDLFPDFLLTTEQNEDNSDGTVPPPNGDSPSIYRRDEFTYHSPDIHYRELIREFGTEMKVYGEMFGPIDGVFTNVNKHPITRMGRGPITTEPYRDHATQFNSVGFYQNYLEFKAPDLNTPTIYQTRFKIEQSQYLLPIKQLLPDGRKFNNYLRESSYYIKVHDNVPNPTTLEVSRFLATDFGYVATEDNEVLPAVDTNKLLTRAVGDTTIEVKPNVTSYYVGIKIKQPDQYGLLEQISYKPVTCIFPAASGEVTYSADLIFGGDVYLSKHSVFRKMPMFTQWLSDVPFTTEINYRDYRNVWYPRNWYDNLTKTNDQYNLDGQKDLIPPTGGTYLAAGRFYLFYTGVIYFWGESEFVGNFRERSATPNGNFYPKADYNDVADSDLIPLPEQFLYNLTLLNTNVEQLKQDLTPTPTDGDYTVIYSQKDDQQSVGDPWLKYLPLNYSILPRTYGKFTGIHSTDMYSIFFIFEDQILYSQINFSLQLSQGNNLLLNQGDVFENRLVKLSNEKTGYAGSVDPWSFINTRFGTFFIDRKRKRLFQWNGQLKDVTGTMESWMEEFLKDDDLSAAYDLSIISVFDNFTGNIYFTEKNQRNRWTVSYKPQLEGFISFHSFTPDYYLQMPNNFLSYSKSDSDGIWKHNAKYLYQSYYGSGVPFDLGLFINSKFKNNEIQNIEIFTEWIKYQGYGSEIYVKDKFFNKIFAYNNNGSTGLLGTTLKNKNNPKQNILQNITNNNPSTIIEVTQVNDSVYRLNKLEDISVSAPFRTINPDGMTYTVGTVNQSLTPHLRGDIKGKWTFVHFISDDNTENKILVQLLVPNEDQNMV